MKYLLLLLLTACTSPKTADYQRQIASITKDFEKEFNTKVDIRIDLVRNFSVALPLNTVAVCYRFEDPKYKPRIEIKESKIDNPNISLEQVAWHENLHCLFNLQHYDKEPDIMNKYVLDREFYLDHRAELIYNLKRRIKK